MTRPKERHYSRNLVFVLRPKNAEFDSMLGDLGQVFPGRQLASVLGISILTLDGWRKGKNGPFAAARKLVWLLWVLLLHPERIYTVFARDDQITRAAQFWNAILACSPRASRLIFR